MTKDGSRMGVGVGGSRRQSSCLIFLLLFFGLFVSGLFKNVVVDLFISFGLFLSQWRHLSTTSCNFFYTAL